MKVGYEILGENLPPDCRDYVLITYCLNCDQPIRNEKESHKEYCNTDCEGEHRDIMQMALTDDFCEPPT